MYTMCFLPSSFLEKRIEEEREGNEGGRRKEGEGRKGKRGGGREKERRREGEGRREGGKEKE